MILNNLYQKATRVIPTQTGNIIRFDSRTKNARGQWITTVAAPDTIEGSFQAIPREKQEQMGLEMKKSYFMLYTDQDISGLKRGASGDFINYAGSQWQVETGGGWKSVDGWTGVLLVRIGDAP